MKKRRKYKLICWGIFSLLLFLTGFSNGYAAPANPHLGKITFEQPDGKTFEGELKGDEYLNYVVADKTEVVVIQGEDGYWQYAQMKRNRTGAQTNGKKYLIDEKPIDALTEEELNTVETPLQKESRTLTSGPLSLTKDQNLLVVLVEFNNQKLNHYHTGTAVEKPTSIEQWHEKFFGEASKRQTLKNYYNEATQNRINLLPATTTQYNEAPGIVRVSLNEDHPNPGIGNTSPEKSYMEKALQQAEDYIDVSAYDKNNNGLLDKNELHVMFVFAGYEASASRATMNTVWGHKSYSTIQSKNGIRFENGYVAIGENVFEVIDVPLGPTSTFKSIAVSSPIGLMAHEFGHDLGLPDLYGPRTANTGYGLGYHSLMAQGGWGTTGNNMVAKPEDYEGANPVHFDAYSKAQLGFPVETIESEQEISTVDARDENFKIYKLPIFKEGVKSEKEYYLIENRQIFGFDEGRRKFNGSEGISVYHINENYRNNLHITKYGEQLVTLKEADESIHGYPLLSKGNKNSEKSYLKKEFNPAFDTKTVPSSMTKRFEYPQFSLAVENEESNIIKIKFKDTRPIKGTYGTSEWSFDRIDNVLTFGSGVFPNTAKSMTIQDVIESRLDGEKIKKIVIAGDSIELTSGEGLFGGLNKLESIEGLDRLDTSGVTSMRRMFVGLHSIKELDVSTFDTSKVTDMSLMFAWCSNLTELDMSSWNTVNVTNMQLMFSGLSKIEHLDVSHLNTSRVTNMADMFSELKAITNLDVTKLDTRNVRLMSDMFRSSSNLTSLDLSNFNTGSVTHMPRLFYGLTKLKTLDLSSFNTRHTKDMQKMFYGCKSLETVNLSNFDTAMLTSAGKDNMFTGCASLDTLVLGRNTLLYDRYGGPGLESKNTLPYSGAWIGPNDTRYNSTELFMSGYKGAVPGTYTREIVN
ncbi:BspA family leucine-rich repeat surface protein [Enterococcus crotali]|uniref:BspA family leucine-rich repeat surface protein n=1 Tax=Enterococcus crotali TaxID=1453587 RepID=UPI00046FE4C5|nr:BspA family leucine-rich repeat surface protein [Enterococcus crotali]